MNMRHPKFRPDLKASEHLESDGSKTVILKEPVSGKFYRLSKYEYELLKALDGSVPLDRALSNLRARGRYYSEEEANAILGRAAQFGLLLGTQTGTAEYLTKVKESLKKEKKARALSSYYFLTIPLINPDRFLERTVWLFRLLFNKWTLGLAALAVPGAVCLIVDGLPRIEREYLFFFNWQNLLYLWVVIVITKLVHEFSHAYTAKSFGLHVPQMGIALLLFIPCLFCNTTDAWRLANRKQRMAISGAGIIAEGALAVFSTYIWYFTQPGLVNSLAFYLMSISLLSSVFFNGNPLIKFDGYFVLMDYLRMPNLAGKAAQHVKHLFMDRVLGIKGYDSPAESARNEAIYTVYGICSFIYRLFLYAGIIAGIYYRFDKFLGIMLAVPAFFAFVVRPVAKGLFTVYSKRKEMRPRPAGALVFGLLVVALGFLLLAPQPGNSVFSCYVTSEKRQKITAPLEAAIDKVFVRRGSVVSAGAVLFTLDPRMLRLKLAQRRVDRDILNKEIELLLLNDDQISMADAKRIELLKVEDDIQRLEEKLKLATGGVRAPFAGVVTGLDPRMKPGYAPGEGEVVGEMECADRLMVCALAPEEDLAKVAVGRDAQVWLPLDGGRVISGKIEGVRQYSERNLADSPFSSRVGGEVATEVRSREQQDAPLAAYYTCWLRVPPGQAIPLGMTGRLIVPSSPREYRIPRFRQSHKDLQQGIAVLGRLLSGKEYEPQIEYRAGAGPDLSAFSSGWTDLPH